MNMQHTILQLRNKPKVWLSKSSKQSFDAFFDSRNLASSKPNVKSDIINVSNALESTAYAIWKFSRVKLLYSLSSKNFTTPHRSIFSPPTVNSVKRKLRAFKKGFYEKSCLLLRHLRNV